MNTAVNPAPTPHANGMCRSGEILRSVSGRVMSPFPKLEFGTNRRSLNTVKRLHAWLTHEAQAEAAHTSNAWHEALTRTLSPKNFTQADSDTCNYVIFGDFDGPNATHRTT